jgi:hypothetical protein
MGITSIGRGRECNMDRNVSISRVRPNKLSLYANAAFRNMPIVSASIVVKTKQRQN